MNGNLGATIHQSFFNILNIVFMLNKLNIKILLKRHHISTRGC